MSIQKQNVPYNYRTIRDRELGMKRRLGYMDEVSQRMYTCMGRDKCRNSTKCMEKGGIFNLEFSPDGKLLVAVCQENAVILFDAFNQRRITKLDNAHDKCVNCVKYLNQYTFATGSDDGLIKLWDTRNLNTNKQTFSGHSNWVKNIEYSERENVMITSAFDGSIYAWDMSCAASDPYEKVFIMNGLMRTKLTPDSSKMLIATTSGYIILVHDLELLQMYNDMKTFRPNLYRLMQVSDQTFPAATMFNYLFNQGRSRNRVEFIDDFPNRAEVVSSIQVHPMGWSVLSRNMSSDDVEEWSSVHDIQTRDPRDYADAYSYIEEPAVPIYADRPEEEDMRPTDIWMGFMTNSNYLADRNPFSRTNDERSYMGVMNSGLIGNNTYTRFHYRRPGDKNKIMKNIPRLTHYSEEISVGKGFIKEPCFSADGRIICSPNGNGVRLFSFNDQVQELSLCVPEKPQKLHTLNVMGDSHNDVVVCSKFNPINNYQLVSGCLGGEVVWYKPNF